MMLRTYQFFEDVRSEIAIFRPSVEYIQQIHHAHFWRDVSGETLICVSARQPSITDRHSRPARQTSTAGQEDDREEQDRYDEEDEEQDEVEEEKGKGEEGGRMKMMRNQDEHKSLPGCLL